MSTLKQLKKENALLKRKLHKALDTIKTIGKITVRLKRKPMETLSDWIDDGHCSMRTVIGGDPESILDRRVLIEKTPRVMHPVSRNWEYGPKGSGEECGRYQPSRDWADAKARELGYKLL